MTPPLLVRRPRALLRATGRDPVRMIQGLATNDVQAVSARQGVYTAFLTAKGRMVADARIFRDPGDDSLLIDVDPEALPALRDHFARFVPPLFARFEDVSAGWSVLGVYGTDARRVARAGIAAVGAVSDTGQAREADQSGGSEGAGDADGASEAGGADGAGDAGGIQLPADTPPEGVVTLPAPLAGFAVRTLLAGQDGWELFAAAGQAAELDSALRDAGAEPGSTADLDRRRVIAGRPGWGAELSDDVIPLEAGLLEDAISQSKGCYTGQEVIVRILHRGHVNRHLRRLRFMGTGDPPEPGTELFDPTHPRARGVVTSMVAASGAEHGDENGAGGALGLGYVRREIEPPAELRAGSIDGPPVRVEALPGRVFTGT